MEDKNKIDLENSEVTQRTNKILGIISKLTKIIKNIPTGEDYNYRLTIGNFSKKKIKKWNKKVACILKDLMTKTTRERDNHKIFQSLTSQTLLENYHYVVDTADDLMEMSNKSIDRHIKGKQAGNYYEREIEKAFKLKSEDQPYTGNHSSEMIKKTLNHLKKPQIDFESKPDNSYYQFVPLILHKPNALEPLDPKIKKLQEKYAKYIYENQKIEYDPDRNVKYEHVPHPYEREITELNYGWNKVIEEVSAIDISKKPLPYDDKNFWYIDNEKDLNLLIEDIGKVKELAVDLEYHSYRSYQGFVWLMQLSTRDKDWIIGIVVNHRVFFKSFYRCNSA